MIWIISGPSSVGKSTFIKTSRCREITGLESGALMLVPWRESNLKDRDLKDCFFHYNTCRPASLALGRKTSDLRDLSAEKLQAALQYETDPKWLDFLQNKAPKKAVLLVADIEMIRERARHRRVVESQFVNPQSKPYDVAYWLKLYEKIDLLPLYRSWCAELERRGIPYVLVDANDSHYNLLPESSLKNQMPETTYRKEEIEKILREEKFEYHRVNLPYGLHTKGEDRSASRDLILPASLAGKSVLDIGCALGYFCFESEARGASRVLGVELDDSRFRQASLLKKILGSRVELVQRDVIENPLQEQFDYVLLLNVIHHLPEPMRMIRQMASLTRKRLVIEFPTFADKKFRRNVGIRFPKMYDRLPLIGVSSQAPGTDQTFVFTSGAIQRILQDHQPLFKTIKTIPSPMSGRLIAICEK